MKAADPNPQEDTMSDHPDHEEDNFVMHAEAPPREENDDRQAFFESSRSGFDLRAHAPLIAGACGLALVLVIAWLFFFGGRGATTGDAFAQLEARIVLLEDKLAKIEWLDQGLARLNKQETDFEGLSEKVAQLEAALKQESARVEKRLAAIKPATAPPLPAAAPAEKAQSTPPAVHVVSTGDTLYSIGRKYNISVNELRRFNNLSDKASIQPGQKLKLSP